MKRRSEGRAGPSGPVLPGFPEAGFFVPGSWKRASFKRRVLDRAFHAPVAVHVTHANCLDGAACDAIVRMALTPRAVRSIFVEPHETLATLDLLTAVPGRARRLIISDLSLQKGQGGRVAERLATLSSEGWRIEWRDHHHKQWENAPMDVLAASAALEVETAGEECGATLVRRALAPEDAFAEELARTVRDHDLWLREIPHSATLEAAKARLGGERLAEILVARRSLFDPAILRAATRQEAQNARLAQWALRRARVDGGIGVAYGRVPTNLVLHELEGRGARLNVLLKPDGAFSLRSAKGADVCHLVAQKFGGGGHPNASGGKLPVRGLGLISYWMQREKHRAARELVDEARKALGH